MTRAFKIGDVVRLKSSYISPIGGWLNNELATIVEGKGPFYAPILVRLHSDYGVHIQQACGNFGSGIVAVHSSNLNQP